MVVDYYLALVGRAKWHYEWRLILNSFHDHIAHISLISKEKLPVSPISIKNMYIEHSLISGMPIFIFWSNIWAKTQIDCLLLNYSYYSIFFSSHRKSPYIFIFSQSFIEICLKFKFLCSKTDFLKKNIQNFRTLRKNMSVSICPSASSRTSAVLKELLVTFSLTLFAYVLKVNVQPNIYFKSW